MPTQQYTVAGGVVEPAGSVVNFDRRANSKDLAGTALDLVAQAAELIRHADDAATEKITCAEALASQAIEKLKTAFERLRASESHRNALEFEIKNLNESNRLASSRLKEFEKIMEQMISRVRDAEARLSIAQDRANAAEDALTCIEEAIQSRILERCGTLFGNVNALTRRAA